MELLVRLCCELLFSKVKNELWLSAKNPCMANSTHLPNEGKIKQTMSIFKDTIWLRFGVCSYLHPGIIFPISNLVHLCFLTLFASIWQNVLLFCTVIAWHTSESCLPPSCMVLFLKCYAPVKHKGRFYMIGGFLIWKKLCLLYWWLDWLLFAILSFPLSICLFLFSVFLCFHLYFFCFCCLHLFPSVSVLSFFINSSSSVYP